jgi:hypothetical protein
MIGNLLVLRIVRHFLIDCHKHVKLPEMPSMPRRQTKIKCGAMIIDWRYRSRANIGARFRSHSARGGDSDCHQAESLLPKLHDYKYPLVRISYLMDSGEVKDHISELQSDNKVLESIDGEKHDRSMDAKEV